MIEIPRTRKAVSRPRLGGGKLLSVCELSPYPSHAIHVKRQLQELGFSPTTAQGRIAPLDSEDLRID